MRILVVTPTFLPIAGGAELGIYEIYQRLGKSHTVCILTPNLSDYLISQHGGKDMYFEEVNFEVHHFNDIFNFTKLRRKKIFGKIIFPFSLSYILAVFKQIRNFKPDVINFHYFVPSGFAIILVRMLTKIPTILSLVGRKDLLDNKISFFKKKYIQTVFKSVSCVISISRFCLYKSARCKSVKVIPYGVDTERFSPKVNGEEIRRKLGICNGKLVLFALQRLVKVKRVDVLIKSMKYILGVNNEVVLVVGGKGPEEFSLKNLVEELGIKDNIIFAGYIPENELPKYFAMSDIFVFYSLCETFGIVLVQAMASGKPIVSVNSTAIPEVVDNGLNGLLVEPLNSKQFAEAVIRLLNDEKLCLEYSRNGRGKAIEKYNWSSIAREYEGVMKVLKL